jgi:hypothetical protein
MKETRKAIKTFLKTLHPSVYFMQAEEKAIYPYLVYDFRLYPDGEGSELCTLSINGWDKSENGDTTNIENLMETLKTLDKEVIISETFAITFFLENMIPLTDDDKTLMRRNYNYLGRLIRR